MNLRATSIVAITSLSLIACDSGVPGNSAISESALSADLHVLADDSMGGRLVASSGLDQASAWIADRFESLGLAPAGDRGGYFQRFGLAWFSLGVGNRLTVEGAGPSRTPGQGWTPSNAGVSGSASGSVVFAGFGIVEPRLDHDDYQGADVNGRIVLMLEREPGVADPSSPR